MLHKASYQEMLDALRAVARGDDPKPRAAAAAADLALLDGDLGFTPEGRRLVEDGLFRGREGVAQDVLRGQLARHAAARALIEGEWGHELTRAHAFEILRYAYPESRSWSEADFGRFLATLNFVGLLTYSKKTGSIRITRAAPIAAPRTEGTLISPSTPYRNKQPFASLVSGARRQLWWFDGHLDRKGLAFLYEEADFADLQEIRLLTCGRSQLTEAAIDDYRRLKEELASRGVQLTWRALLDREDFTDKHDRWLRSGDIWWNVPAFSSVMTNKFGSLLEDTNDLPFDEWWSAGTEVTEVGSGA